MRRWCVAFALAGLFALPLVARAADSPSEYSKLLARLKSGNTDIDYTRLRLSYPDSPERKAAKDVSGPEKGMWDALEARNFSEAVKQVEMVLASEYVNIDAHFVALVANRELGAKQDAEFHQAIFRGLIQSILQSGDGESMGTAWVMIDVHEEYVILRVLGYGLPEQSLVQKDGHSYDVLKSKSNKDGTERTFYFNVDIPFKHYGV